jgi:hypothetical protein
MPTVTFDIVYVFFVLSLERRRVLHVNRRRTLTRHGRPSNRPDFERPGAHLPTVIEVT